MTQVQPSPQSTTGVGGIAPISAGDPRRDQYPASMVGGSAGGYDGSYADTLLHRSEAGRFEVHRWASAAGTLLVTSPYPVEEFCTVVEGHLVITNENGDVVEFREGDSFAIPKGWQGTWEMRTEFVKQYVIGGQS